MKKKMIAVMLVVFMFAAVMSSCSKANVAAKKIKICFITVSTGNPYFDPIISGMKKACADLGAEFTSVAPATADPTSQIPLINSQVQQGVNAICISPNSVDALLPALANAKAKGVKIITVSEDITGNEGDRLAAVMCANYDDLGKNSFEEFAKEMNYTGSFVVESSTTDAPFQNHQIQIYKDLLQQDQFKNMKLLEIDYGNDDANKSLSDCETLLQKYSDLKGIMCPTTVAIVGAAQAVENADKQGKVVVYGLGTANQSRDFIKSGVEQGCMLWDTYRTGIVAGTLAYDIVKGTVTPKVGVSFDVKGYSAVTFTTNNTIYAGPPLALDKSNIDQYNF
jgi:rhamnose transport system substrate-binding protein